MSKTPKTSNNNPTCLWHGSREGVELTWWSDGSLTVECGVHYSEFSREDVLGMVSAHFVGLDPKVFRDD